MQGQWQLVDGVVDGEKIDVEGFGSITIHDNIMTLPFGEVSPVSFKLDTSKKPKQITVIIKSLGTDAKMNGIYWLDGDDLQFCFADKGEDIPPPKDFVSKPGSGHRLFICKRLKPPKVEKKETKANESGLDYRLPHGSPVALDFGFPINKVPVENKQPFKVGGDFIFLNSLEYQIPIKANDFSFWVGFFGHSLEYQLPIKANDYSFWVGFFGH
jgi:uncharacterized protein (TIGR03067 family)